MEIRKNTAPCKECSERHINCHSACQRYREYRDTLDERNAKNEREKAMSEFCYDSKRKVIRAYVKRKWNK